MDPLGQNPQPQEVKDAISEILEIAKQTPGGYGLEMGLYWGLFMAGVAIFNDDAAEDLIRQKLKADKSISIYVSICYAQLWIRVNNHSMPIDLLIFSRFFGKDSINMARSMIGAKYRSRWESKCELR
jgi:hypothetical protein